MRNYNKFQQNVSLQIVVHTSWGYVKLIGNTSVKHIKNDIPDFLIQKYFDITTRSRRNSSRIQVLWQFELRWILTV